MCSQSTQTDAMRALETISNQAKTAIKTDGDFAIIQAEGETNYFDSNLVARLENWSK